MNFLKDKKFILILLLSITIISCKHHEDHFVEYASYVSILLNQSGYYTDATGCSSVSYGSLYNIDISTSGNKKCASVYDQTKYLGGGVIFDYTTGVKVNPIEVNLGGKFVCKCPNKNSLATGETQWYKRDNATEFKATLFFTHTYQKDANGNITGVDPFIPTVSGDTYYCLLTVCEDGYKGSAYILKIK